MKKQITTNNQTETEALAAKIGAHLKGGEVLELVSDLGGGKTTFTRGLAKGMGSSDHVSSPTFMISRVYRTDKLAMHHFDFYRLPEAGLIEHELEDVLDDPQAVTVVEWSGVIQHVLPEQRLTITLERTGDDGRSITIEGPDELAYLVKDIA